MNIEIDNYWELLALHKSLMAVKFDPAECLSDAQGSPYTASLAFKVFNLLVKSCQLDGKDKEANEWLQWQKADETRIETKLMIQKLNNDSNKKNKEKFIRDFMAPLILEIKLVRKIAKNC